jgi:hypothetical protein
MAPTAMCLCSALNGIYTTQERFFLLAVLGSSLEKEQTELQMNGLIYLIGLIVVIMAVLSLLGLR